MIYDDSSFPSMKVTNCSNGGYPKFDDNYSKDNYSNDYSEEKSYSGYKGNQGCSCHEDKKKPEDDCSKWRQHYEDKRPKPCDCNKEHEFDCCKYCRNFDWCKCCQQKIEFPKYICTPIFDCDKKY